MKFNLKTTTLLLSGLMLGSTVLAQTIDTPLTNNYVQPFSSGSAFKTWSFGIHAGMITPYTFIGGKQDFKGRETQLGYGAYVKKQILPSFGLEAEYFGGQIAGNGSPTTTNVQPYASYSTQLNWTAALAANITLANINWRHNQGAIQPYLTLGGGYMAFTPKLYSGTGSRVPLATSATDFTEFFIPVGVGLKFDIAKDVNLDLGYQMNFVNSDFVDGYAYGYNNDKFAYAHAGLEFAFGGKGKPQLATHNPVSSMRYEYMTKAQTLQTELDAQKAENDRLRADLNATNNNLAATNANLAKLTQDSDGDGVPDLFDKCPNTPAGTKVDGSGCPLPVAKAPTETKVYITEEDKKVVKDAIANLEFDLGKATIRPHSFPSLDKVARLLVDKNFSLKLAGHTDNTGSPEFNMRLSKDRAESIKNYLVGKGANPSRIEATGYGETQPIATNKTAAGRQKNRRVEFTLY
ncbi:flagellar motor protein MotB [Mucilaginibacter sp. PPCGB 2223]|uniref:OmpA family protein n=1 Tax=Mucilaginibacter sp. PPCGB 2223 TaxID=1886027 RepID=UPI000825BB50|nr:OmpA family protein [Mucilaginibacter sp. PPCGB 2223]OCX54111.1 flagellar motor protein MotB [Mucilaginibacter sp. PPCGB 2223]